MFDLVILAAGTGTRMQKRTPKQYLLLCGKPIIIHTLEVFEQHSQINKKIITTEKSRISSIEKLLHDNNISNFIIVPGGSTRQESVWNALQHVTTERLITHNATLPFVTMELIDKVINIQSDCVTTVTPLEYNIAEGEDFGERIISRDRLKLINSPQTFITSVFKGCHEKAREEGLPFSSDCGLMLHYGKTVRFTPGSSKNFKITTPLDFAVAETIMQNPSIFKNEID